MTALGTYKLDIGTFPTTEQGLQALRDKPGDVEQLERPVSAEGSAQRSLGPSLYIQVPRRSRR